MPSLLLVRHGQASYGSPNYDVLSDRGHEQAAHLTAELQRQEVSLASVGAGSLQRHQQTALPIASAAGLPVLTEPGFNEYDAAGVVDAYSEDGGSHMIGDGSSTLSSDAFQDLLDPAVRRWISAGDNSALSESWTAFALRASDALAAFSATLESGDTGLVATSGGVIAALCVRLLGLPDEAFVALNRVAVNAGVTKILIGRRGMSVVSYNEHGYLAAAQRSLVTYR